MEEYNSNRPVEKEVYIGEILRERRVPDYSHILPVNSGESNSDAFFPCSNLHITDQQPGN